MAMIDPQKIAASLVRAQQDVNQLIVSLKDISQNALLAGGDVSKVLTNNLNKCIEGLEQIVKGQEQHSIKSLIAYIGALPLSTFYSNDLQNQISSAAATAQTTAQAVAAQPKIDMSANTASGPQSAIVNESNDFSLLSKYFKELKEEKQPEEEQQSAYGYIKPVQESQPTLTSYSTDTLDFNQLFESGIVQESTNEDLGLTSDGRAMGVTKKSLKEASQYSTEDVIDFVPPTGFDLKEEKIIDYSQEHIQESTIVANEKEPADNKEQQPEKLTESLSNWRNIGANADLDFYEIDNSFSENDGLTIADN